jgi:hypothetical protein
VESRTFFKVAGAFSAGVLLALGGAILYSRQPGPTSPVLPTPPVSVSTVSPSSTVAAPKLAGAPEETADERREASVSQTAEAKPASAPARRRNAVPDLAKAAPERPVQIATLRRSPPFSDTPSNSQLPSSAPPSAPVPGQNTSVTEPPPVRVTAVQTSPQPAAAQNPVPAQEPHVVTLPAGTTVSVRVGETLTSERNSNGDTFQATLDAPIVAEGFIIAERRSRVVGNIIQSSRAGRVKGLANLTLAVSEINTTDGQRVPIETDSYEKWGNSSVKNDTAKVAGAAALGAIIGALAGGGKGAAIGAGAGGAAGTGVALGTRGAAASVPSESILTFRLARAVTITEKFN